MARRTRRSQYPRRGPWLQESAKQCPDPQPALQNGMERDAASAAWLPGREQALGQGRRIVDGQRTVAGNAELGARRLTHSAGVGP